MTVPDVVIFPTLLVPASVNHRAASFSGPAAIPDGSLPAGSEYSVTVPDVVIFPTLLVPASVNHKFLSTPAAILDGALPTGSEYSVTTPDVVIFPILFVPEFVNHKTASFSGPAVIPDGLLPAGRLKASVVRPDVVSFGSYCCRYP